MVALFLAGRDTMLRAVVAITRAFSIELNVYLTRRRAAILEPRLAV